MESATDRTFERQLFERAAKQKIPLYGCLELLPLCNLNCDMCYVRLSREEMAAKGQLRTAEEWLSLADEMKKAGTLFLLLTGGEPLLFPDFKYLFKELQKMGMILTLNTNGTLITEEWAAFFAENKPRRINVTLYGSSDETYERLCHIRNGYQKTIQGIHLLQSHNLDVKINGSLVKSNFNDRMDIIRLGKDLDIPVRIDTYMYPATRERNQPYNLQSRLAPETAAKARAEILKAEMGDDLFRQYASQTLERALNTPPGESVPGRMTCRAAQSSFVINWQGYMRSCIVLNSPQSPVFEVGLKAAWEEIVQKTQEIRTSSKCNSCTLRTVCITCAASAMAECGSCDAAAGYVCQYTKTFIQCLKEYLD